MPPSFSAFWDMHRRIPITILLLLLLGGAISAVQAQSEVERLFDAFPAYELPFAIEVQTVPDPTPQPDSEGLSRVPGS